jgi:hypothetical protein
MITPHIRSVFLLLLGVAAVPRTASGAEVLDVRKLFEQAQNAYSHGDFFNAAIFLYAYEQRNPLAMTRDNEHAKSVENTLGYAKRDIERRLKEAEEDRKQVEECNRKAGLGSTTRGVTTPPPDLRPASSGSANTDLNGTYNMVHDGWKGVLTLSGDHGSYTGSDGKQFTVRAEVDGYHFVIYIIGLGGQNTDGTGGQKFDGYLMTRTRDAIAGVTWWENQPFGFYGIKTP